MKTEPSMISMGLKNVKISLVFNILTILLQFVSRKVFIEYMGLEIMGLNSTAMNFLRFLNFAELGIVSGVRFMLYKPCHYHDRETINDILTLQGILYRHVSLFIAGCAIILMCFFPMIFKGCDFPLWMAYASFIILLAGSLIGNFFNYRQIMFGVTQTEYKITTGVGIITYIKVLLQIAAMCILDEGYICWLSMETVFCVVTAVWVRNKTRKDFPFLKKVNKNLRTLISEYGILVVKVRQLFFHRIGSIVYTEILPIIIFAFISLEEVTIYGNYNAIFRGVSILCASTLAGVTAGIGDLIAGNDRERTYNVFHEIFAIRFVMAGVACLCLYTLSQPMIVLWLGKEFLLSDLSLFLMVLSLFITLLRTTIDTFIQAAGLFQDIWATVVETILNLGGAIVGGYLYGLNGILAGYRIGSVLILIFWKPLFLFRNSFHSSSTHYNLHLLKSLLILAATTAVCLPVIRHLTIESSASWIDFGIYSMTAGTTYLFVMSTLTYLFDPYFKTMIKKIFRKI